MEPHTMTAYRFIGITLLLFFGLLTAPALAHSPYLKPGAFTVPHSATM